MRRIITGAIIALLVTLTAGISYHYYQRYRVILSDPFNAIPTNSALIFECQSGSAAAKELESTGFWENWSGNTRLTSLSNIFHFADSVSQTNPAYKKAWTSKPLYLSWHLAGSSGAGWLSAMSIPLGFTYQEFAEQIGALFPGRQFSERTYEEVTIYEDEKDGRPICYAISKGVLLLSESPVLLEDAIRQSRKGTPLKKDRLFSKLVGATNPSVIRIYLNSIGLRDLLESAWNPDKNAVLEFASRMVRWSGLQVRILKDEIRLGGVSASAEGVDWMNMFRGSQPQPIEAVSILPERTAFLLWMGSERMEKILALFRTDQDIFPNGRSQQELRANLMQAYGEDLANAFEGAVGSEAGLAITEAAGTDLTNNILVFYRGKKGTDAARLLQGWSKIPGSGISRETYRGKLILSFPDNRWALLTIGNISTSWAQTAVAFVNGYFIVGSRSATLKTLIDDLSEGRQLTTKKGFSENLRRLGNEQNILIYSVSARSKNLISTFFNGQKTASANWQIQDAFIVIRERKDQLFQLEAALTKGVVPEREPSVLWSTQLDTTLHAGPYLLPGDEHAKYYVTAQDKRGDLYLFNESGNLLWKVLIKDTLIGSIHTIDYYKQGKWELLFNTSSRLFLLDRDGRTVANYPLRLPAPASCGLSLIVEPRVAGNKILVPCTNGNVYCYQLNGTPDPDWRSDKPVGSLSTPLQRVQQGKEYFYAALTLSRNICLIDNKGKIVWKSQKNNLKKMVVNTTHTDTSQIFLLDDSGLVYSAGLDGRILLLMDTVNVRDLSLVSDSLETDLVLLTRDSLLTISKAGTTGYSMNFAESPTALYRKCPKELLISYNEDSRTSWIHRYRAANKPGQPLHGLPGPQTENSIIQLVDKITLTDGENLLYFYTLE